MGLNFDIIYTDCLLSKAVRDFEWLLRAQYIAHHARARGHCDAYETPRERE